MQETAPTRPSRPTPIAEIFARLTVLGLAAVLSVAVVVGGYAAVAGGSASAVGSGPGGLGGIPQLALFGVVVLLAIPSGLLALLGPTSRGSRTRAVLLLAGPVVVALGYFFFAHAVDPCTLGVWDVSSRVGDAPLCGTAAGTVAMAPRFHLLEHGLATSLLLVGHVALLRRLRPVAG